MRTVVCVFIMFTVTSPDRLMEDRPYSVALARGCCVLVPVFFCNKHGVTVSSWRAAPVTPTIKVPDLLTRHGAGLEEGAAAATAPRRRDHAETRRERGSCTVRNEKEGEMARRHWPLMRFRWTNSGPATANEACAVRCGARCAADGRSERWTRRRSARERQADGRAQRRSGAAASAAGQQLSSCGHEGALKNPQSEQVLFLPLPRDRCKTLIST